MSGPQDSLELHLCAELGVEEDSRAFVYDDATGKTFKKGDTLIGNLTVAVGVNLMIGLSPEEMQDLTLSRVRKARAELAPFAWYSIQDMVRQTALCDLNFNLGLKGLLHWPHFIAYMAQKDYPDAVAQVTSNQIWTHQVGPRAGRIEGMILTGQWPKDIPV